MPTSKSYEKSMLAWATWRAAKSDNIDELLAIACTFRNRWLRYGKAPSQVLEAAEINRPWPDIKHPIFIDPQNGLLQAVEDIYDNIAPDYTSNHLQKDGALWFCQAFEHQGKRTWMDINILDNPNEHPLIGQWGTQQFYK
jgi:hypothetical protein